MISSPKSTFRWTTSCRRRCWPTRNGPSTRRTTGRCRRWPTRLAGPIAKIGSRGRISAPNSSRNTIVSSSHPRPGTSCFKSRNSSPAKRSTARRCTARTSSPSAARKASRWASPTRCTGYGFLYDDPKKPYRMSGFVNSPGAVEGLEIYKKLYKCCQPPGLTNAYMPEGLDAFKSGQVAMQMNWFAFFPGLYKDPNVGGDKIGFFVNPGQKYHATQLGGQGISVVSYSDKKDDALKYIKWFAQPAVQQKWWELGGYSAAKSVVGAPGFPASQPFAPAFLTTMGFVKDFWAEPLYVDLLLDMQKRVHDYVVADKGTAKEALDLLVKDWTKVFKDEGKEVAAR